MEGAHRSEGLWLAHMIHRVSGVLLGLFLPLHFLVLGLALEGAEALDPFLRFADLPWVKLAEFVLVALLGVHLFGGTRILILEFLPWNRHHKTLASVAFVLALLAAIWFFLNAVSA